MSWRHQQENDHNLGKAKISISSCKIEVKSVCVVSALVFHLFNCLFVTFVKIITRFVVLSFAAHVFE
jgi:hypothetical protein